MLLVTLVAFAFQEPLYSPIRVQAGGEPVDLVALDLTGDGAAELVSANADSEDVVVLIARGGGAFAPPVSYPAGVLPRELASGDLDQDGLADLVVLADALDVLLGQGGGVFGSVEAYPIGAFGFAEQLALGDADGDGHVDAAVGYRSAFTSGVAIQPGDGAGGFGSPVLHASGVELSDVAFGDANGDGLLDLWVSTYGPSGAPSPGTVELSLGTAGAFGTAAVVALGTNPSDVDLRDLDLDGDLDAVVGDWDFGKPIHVLAGDGAGGFATPLALAAGSGPRTVTTADLDRDGDFELLAGDYYGTAEVHVLANLGGLAFAAAKSFDAGNHIVRVVAGDVTGDGELDAAVVNLATTSGEPGSITILAGLADLDVEQPKTVAGLEANDVDLADLDGDGAVDAVLTGPGGVALCAGDGSSFGAPIVYAVGPAPENAVIADFDGDGAPDVGTVSHDHDVAAVSLGDGAGGLAAAASFATSDGPRAIAAGDLDGDGAVDLAVSCEEAAALDALRGDGFGAFGAPQPFPSVEGARALVLGDLDGDGTLDAAAAGEGTYFDVFPAYFWEGNGAGAIHLGDGAGGFGAPQVLTPPILAMDVALADVDFDGALDVAVLEQFELSPFGSYAGRGRVLLHHGDGAGGFSAGEVLAPYGTWGHAYALAAGDLDRDGDADFAVQDLTFQSLIVHRNDGLGAWQPLEFAAPHGTFLEPVFPSLALHDVDQDGSVDLLASGYQSTVQKNLSSEPAGLAQYGAGTPGCAGTQALGANRAPAVGASDFALTCTSAPPHAAGAGAVGLAADAAGTLALGVLFHVSLAAPLPVTFGLASDAAGTAFAPLPIPSQPGLAGVTVYAQTVWSWPASALCDPSPLLLSTSRGLAISIF